MNSLKWSSMVTNADLVAYYKGLIALRKAHPAFRMDTAAKIKANLTFTSPNMIDAIGYTINGSAVGEGTGWGTIFVGVNGTKAAVTLSLPSTGSWTIVVNGSKAGVTSLGTVTGNKVVLPAGTAVVLHK